MRKILSSLLIGCMLLSLVGCGKTTTDTDIKVDFGAFEEQNKDDSIVNDAQIENKNNDSEISISTPEKPEVEENIDNKNENIIIDNGEYKIAHSKYSKDILDSDMSSKRFVNGVSESKVVVESTFLNFVGVSWPATQKAFDEIKEISYEEAVNFRETYADILKPTTKSWIEENFTEDKIYLLVNSTTFHRLYSAYPDISYDEETNSAYLIFEKEHSHWYVDPITEGMQDKILAESNSTATLLVLDKNEVKNLDTLYVVTPHQFVEDENDIDINWFVSNEDELVDEDKTLISFMMFDALEEMPQGYMRLSIDEARDFIDKYLDKENIPQINIEAFLQNKELFIINDRHLQGANDLASNVRALERASRLYVELYSDVEATDDGMECVVVGIDPLLYNKYEQITFVIDDN